jgi:hypothetical protein
MDGGGQATAAPQQPAATNPPAQQVTVSTSRARPAWVDSVDAVYSRARYVAAVGAASDRTLAERYALANLVAFFGQSIQADRTTIDTYQEAVRSGVVTGWASDISMQNTIRTTAAMDTLVGADVREVWHDTRNNMFFAVAVMEKAMAARIYTDMILANQNMIANLISMTPTERNSLDGFSRYQFAATVADINVSYGNLLRLIDAVPPDGLIAGEFYRSEARRITETIPIGIRVTNDRAGRIQGAFARAFSDIGFRSGGAGSRYMLEVDVVATPTDHPNQNRFVRIDVDARLTDNGITILPYNFNTREGHATLAEAENQAYSVAVRIINDGNPRARPPSPSYVNILRDYLARLVPERR